MVGILDPRNSFGPGPLVFGFSGFDGPDHSEFLWGWWLDWYRFVPLGCSVVGFLQATLAGGLHVDATRAFCEE